MGGSGAIGAILVANDTSVGPNGTPLVERRTKTEGVKRGPFFFVGNTAKVGGSPGPGLRIGDVSGLLIAGNRLDFNTKRKRTVLSAKMEPPPVFGNFLPGAEQFTSEEFRPHLVESGNFLPKQKTTLPRCRWLKAAMRCGFLRREEWGSRGPRPGRFVALHRDILIRGHSRSGGSAEPGPGFLRLEPRASRNDAPPIPLTCFMILCGPPRLPRGVAQAFLPQWRDFRPQPEGGEE
jgi:hypothetical protein